MRKAVKLQYEWQGFYPSLRFAALGSDQYSCVCDELGLWVAQCDYARADCRRSAARRTLPSNALSEQLGENTRFICGISAQLIAEFDGATGNLRKEYVYGGGSLITIEPTAVNSNGTQYTTTDALPRNEWISEG